MSDEDYEIESILMSYAVSTGKLILWILCAGVVTALLTSCTSPDVQVSPDATPPPDAVPTSPLGAACDLDSECETMQCYGQLDPHPFIDAPPYYLTDGICSQDCYWEIDADNLQDQIQGNCPEDTYCVRYNQGDQICITSCQTNDDCRDKWECYCIDFPERCAKDDAIRICLPEGDAA